MTRQIKLLAPLVSLLALGFSASCSAAGEGGAPDLSGESCDSGGRGGAGPGAAGGAGRAGAAGASASGGGGGAWAGAAGTTGGPDAAGSGGAGGGALPEPARGRVIVYYPAWAIYARSFEVSDLPAERFTHLNYAFANVSPSGECELGDPWADVQRTAAGDSWEDQAAGRAGNFRRLRELKARHPHLRTLISVGGWTWSGRFSDVAATAEGRERFARSCAAFTDEHGFDGLDLDWEYPVEGGLEGNSRRPEDAENFVALLTALRRELDARSAPRAERLLLTIAASASPAIFGHQDLARVSAPLDWINLMTYDFHGPWSSFVGHNAPLHASPLDPSADPIQRTRFNAAAAVEAYLAAGVAASRLSLGVPFYGRAFGGVPATNHGLFTTASSSPPAGTWEPGVFDFHDLASRYVNRQGFERHWDQHSRVPFLYSSSARVFISYDDEDSLFEKARLARDRGLGGVMAWDVTGDVRGSWPLLEALRRGLSE